MAERSTNININYRVNVVEIQKAEQASQKAQQATDRLRQSAEQVGSSSQRGFQQAGAGAKQFGSSLEALRLRQVQLKASIELTNQSEKARLDSLSTQYKKVSSEIDKLEKTYLKLNKTAKEFGNSAIPQIEKTTSAFGNLTQAVSAYLTLGFARQIVTEYLEMAKLAGAVDSVGRAFQKQIPNADLLLNNLRRSTRGAVTDLELMQKALQAKNLGIAVESLPKLLEFAAVRAQQTGVSVDYLVNSIVNGIGRKSTLILDNLGISAVRLKQEFNGASLAAQSVGDVTAAVARIAQEEMEKMGGFVENSATKVDQLAVSWHELGVEIAKSASSNAILDFSKDVIDNLKIVAEVFRTGIGAPEIIQKQLRDAFAIDYVTKFYESLKGSRDENITSLQEEINKYKEQITSQKSSIDATNRQIETLKRLESASTFGNRTAFNQYKNLESQVIIRKEHVTQEERIVELLNSQLEALKKQVPEQQENLGLIEKQKELIEALQDQQSKSTTESDLARVNIQLKEANKELQRLLALGNMYGLIERARQKVKDLNDEIASAKSVDAIKSLNIQLDIANGELNDLVNAGRQLNTLFSELAKKRDITNIVEGLFPKDSNALKGATDKLSKDYIDSLKQSFDERLKAVGNGEGAIDLGINVKIGEKLSGTPFIGPDGKPTGGLILEIVPDIKEDAWDKIAEEFAKHRNELISTGIFGITDVITAGLQAEADAYDARLSQIRDYYDQQQVYAGDNEKAKDRLREQEKKKERQLRLEAFEADKEYKRKATLINGAAAVINAFATLPYPAAIVASLAIAASTASQIAVINKQQPRFKEGVLNLQGPGTTTSDSIHARLSKGESVMTAAETKGSFHVLKAVRAGRLNDEVMKDIVRGTTGGSQFLGQTFDPSPIVNEIRELRKSQPNYAKEYGVLYETRQSTDNFKKKARSKSMSI